MTMTKREEVFYKNLIISDEDMMLLKNINKIKNYGEFSVFPVYGKI